MIKNPKQAYARLGFSPTAIEMLHNVIRGQGAALLAISGMLFYLGPKTQASYLLVALTCGLSLIAHILAARHHLRSGIVMEALGNITPIYPIIGINLVLGIMAVWLFITR
jgi:hypothetical protein